jgi:hypothetical protein
MNLKTTVFGVYILESLKSDDYADGENLHAILEESHFTNVYEWIDSKAHLKKVLKDFRESKFRYLYISCHANAKGIEINGEFILNAEFQQLLGPIPDKRVFTSACKGSNDELANLLIGKSKALSLIGSPEDLDFDKGAVFWPAFFYLMKATDEKKMVREEIRNTIKKLVDLFDVPFNYYSKITGEPAHLRRLKIRAGKPTDNTKLLIKNRPIVKAKVKR